MMDDLAELRQLEELRPPQERELPAGAMVVRRRVLLHELRRARRPAIARRLPRGWSGRRWAALAAIVSVAAVAGASFAAYALTRTADQAVNGVSCYGAASRSAFAATEPANGLPPTRICTEAWQNGQMGVAPGSPVPHWVACAGERDGVDVFPSSDEGLCHRLGLAPLPAGYERAARRFAAMRDELDSQLQGGCTGESSALALTRRVLERNGFDGWTIRTEGFGEASPCAVADFDALRRVVTLGGQVRPELMRAVERVTDPNRCGSRDAVVSAVQGALTQAGFSDWRVSVRTPSTGRSLCVAGFNPEPATKTVVLTGSIG